METVSGEQKTKGLFKQIYEERKKARRREKYFSCFALFIAMLCLVLVACALAAIIVGIIEVIHYF